MSETILIVEDEVKIARLLQLELEYEGYRTVIAYSGMDGLLAFREKDGDLEYDFDIDAVTGDVKEYEEDRGDDQSSSAESAPIATNGQKMLTQEEAVAFVQERVSGTLTKFELDDNHYELEFQDGNTEYDIEMNPYTGEIIEFEKDDDWD